MTALTTTVTETPATSVATVKTSNHSGTTTSTYSPQLQSTTTTQATVKVPEVPKGKDNSTRFWHCIINADFKLRLQYAASANTREYKTYTGTRL
jgi:hypothetical protein